MKSIFLLLFLANVANAMFSYAQCYDRFTRRAISNYLPLAEFNLVSLTTCMQNCMLAQGNGPRGEQICKSFTYNIKVHSCMLFDHNGYKVPAVLHPALEIDLYTRKEDVDGCQAPPLTTKTEKSSGNPNFVHLQEKPITSSDDYVIEEKSAVATGVNDITSFRTHESAEKTEQIQANDIHERSVLHKRARVHAEPIVQIDGDLKVPEGKEELTPIGSKACKNGYYVVLGTEIQKGEDTEGLVQVLEDVEQGDCARLCSQNAVLDGTTFDCKSLNYYPETRKCELYSIQVEPNGPGKFLANPHTIYSEKFCMPDSAKICQEDEVFILHVQKNVVGRKLKDVRADGITPCLTHCLKSLGCKAAVYDDNHKKCSLFSTDLSSESEALVDTQPGAVAIENPCVDASPKMRASKTVQSKSNRKKDSANDWSECSYKIDGKTVKVRLNEDETLEVKEC